MSSASLVSRLFLYLDEYKLFSTDIILYSSLKYGIRANMDVTAFKYADMVPSLLYIFLISLIMNLILLKTLNDLLPLG